MKKTALVALVVLTISGTARAALIELVPASTTVSLGEQFDLALTISGLGDGVAPSVGTYDVDVSFDPSVLQPLSVAIGDPVLGDQLDLFGLGSILSVTPSAGMLNLFELSLDLPTDLDDLQAPAFTLATLTFQAIDLGVSSVTPGLNALGDSLGSPIDFQATGAQVNVRGSQQAPEPNSLALLVLGVVTAFGLRRRCH